MKRTLLILIGILLSFKVSAQSADEFINSVIEKNKLYNDISIVFNYVIVDESNGVNEKMNGYGSMKGNSYVINVGDQLMICDGTTLWNYLIEDQEVMVSDVTDDSSSSPIAIINSFAENTTAKFLDSNDANIKIVELKEKDNNVFDKIQMSIDKRDFKIKNIHVFNIDGSEFIYDITSFITDQNLPDNMFIFDESLHPNVEIIDMR